MRTQTRNSPRHPPIIFDPIEPIPATEKSKLLVETTSDVVGTQSGSASCQIAKSKGKIHFAEWRQNNRLFREQSQSARW